MDAERDRGLSERFSPGTIDAELRRALAVEPSAGFQARVRARIAEEGESRRFGWKWLVVPAAALTAAALLVLALRIANAPRGVAPATAPVLQSTSVPAPAVPSLETPREPDTAMPSPDVNAGAPASRAAVASEPSTGRSTERRQPDALRTARRAATLAPELIPEVIPEVIFDPREREGLRRLLDAISAGRVDTSKLIVNGPTSTEPLPPIVDLSVPPLPDVTPLDAGGF